nr:MAG TPA: tail tape measure [Caudoviricetes sp.]
MNLFNLFARLFLDTKDFDENLDKSQKKASSFSSKAGTVFKAGARAVTAFATTVAAASTAIAALGTKMINFAGDIDDNAQRIGMSTDDYQLWAFAIEKAGGDAQTLAKAVQNISVFTEKLAEGNGDALLTLQKLGIEYDDFMKADNAGKLKMIVESLQGMEDQTEKTRLAQEIFGSETVQKLMPLLNEERGSIDKLNEELKKQGLIIDNDLIKAGADLGDQIQFLTKKFQVMGLSIASELFPEISLLIDGISDLASGSKDGAQKIADAFIGIADKIFQALPDILDVVGNLVLALFDGLIKLIPEVVPKLFKFLEQIIIKLIQMIPSLTKSLFKLVEALINGLLDMDWGEILIQLIESVSQITPMCIDTLSHIFSSLLNKVFFKVTDSDFWKKVGDFGLRFGKAMINSVIASFEAGINFIVDRVNDITAKLSKVWTWTGLDAIPEIPHAKIPRLAKGGMLDDLKGTMFAIAGEDGAEVVAHGSQGTGVANVQQIAEAQYSAMEQYNVKETIATAAAAIVNGIVTGISRMRSDAPDSYILRIGDKDFKAWVTEAVNQSLLAKGRKSLNTITEY